MRIKRFEADSVRQALEMVRSEMGPDALILETRDARRRGVLGLLRKAPAVVTAVAPEKAVRGGGMTSVRSAAAPAAPAHPAAPAAPAALAASGVLATTLAPVAPVNPAAPAAPPAEAVQALHRELKRMNSMVGSLLRTSASSLLARIPEAAALYDALIEQELNPETALRIVSQVGQVCPSGRSGSAVGMLEACRDVIAGMVAVTGPISAVSGRRLVVALVGPTGVGKTTTIAKLAAHFSLVESRRVALLTTDTYRIAAVEQLRTFADIIGIPLEVAYAPGDVASCLSRLGGFEVVLVDTAGRNPRNATYMNELREFMVAIGPDQVHLTLSATTGTRELIETTVLFGPLRPDAVLFTKLDEAGVLGPVLDTVLASEKPISYFTTGQNVPDDFEAASAAGLAAALVGLEGAVPAGKGGAL